VRWLIAVAAAVAIASVGAALAVAAREAAAPVELEMRYSEFSRTRIEARAGVPLTVVLRNDDPIDHEWIVGDDALHERHRDGTEPVHASRATEVTVPAGEQRETTVTFDRPGTYRFICHLPGHEAYGMVGTVVVEP
jgi:uncharacterized cupredoxin-like copper-binding protein